MTALHSPGRWVGRGNHVETESGGLIADVYAPTATGQDAADLERLANRELIAAAPELADMLLQILDHPDAVLPCQTLAEARDLLARLVVA